MCEGWCTGRRRAIKVRTGVRLSQNAQYVHPIGVRELNIYDDAQAVCDSGIVVQHTLNDPRALQRGNDAIFPVAAVANRVSSGIFYVRKDDTPISRTGRECYAFLD